MEFKPHKYQDYAREFIIGHPVCALILDMGLGKTVITLTALWELALDYFEVGKVLVIAPFRVARDTWKEELEKWNTLVEWWKENNKENDGDPELELYGRLRASLDSEAEKIFFRAYYNYYRHPIKKDIPALVPQVYLHYDPRSKYQRKGQVVYSHQRMDFLMLLPGGIQIVFELDGQQHYSQNGKAVPALYAEMVKDDRALRLKGYEVYRFGGHEFLDENSAKQMICEFFDKLFERYEIDL